MEHIQDSCAINTFNDQNGHETCNLLSVCNLGVWFKLTDYMIARLWVLLDIMFVCDIVCVSVSETVFVLCLWVCMCLCEFLVYLYDCQTDLRTISKLLNRLCVIECT